MREKWQGGSRGVKICGHGAAALIAKIVAQASKLATEFALLLALLQLNLQQLKQQLLCLDARHLSILRDSMGAVHMYLSACAAACVRKQGFASRGITQPPSFLTWTLKQ